MNIQIIKRFIKRTEYKVLKDWVSVNERNIDDLMSGVCVIPAIILLKLSERELHSLKNWWEQWGNQLIVSPPFHQMDVVALLQLHVDLSIRAIDAKSFHSLPVVEAISTNSKPKWKLDDGGTVAVDHYEHSGSGCVTFTTIPLLDYRLWSQQDICRKLFFELINVRTGEKTANIQISSALNPVHEYILILASAKVLNPTNLSSQLSYYFKRELSQNKALELFQQLAIRGYLDNSNKLTNKGEKYINLKGYSVFVREIKRRRYDDGEWR